MWLLPNIKTILKFLFLFMSCGYLYLTIISWDTIHSYIKNPSVHQILTAPPHIRLENQLKQSESQKEQTKSPPNKHQKRDWHDYKQMQSDAKRRGSGEHGKKAKLNEPSLKVIERKTALQNGFNAMVSDSISVTRSVPDIRHPACLKKLYPAELPLVSVIIPFFNEHFSVLVRTLYSIANRTPAELLKEIILVDDFSDRENLFQKLDAYVKEHFPKVRIERQLKRYGIVGARLTGAHIASGDVLVFLESHVEVNYNWLPPLLEPIVENSHTVVCPFIDVIDDWTFEYFAQDEGMRGAFDWNFNYKRLPRLDNNTADPTKPFESPVMAGGLFAISRKYFWELGGYDEELELWGGEQYELSFKIWMCGGTIVDAPCSRVGHIYRGVSRAVFSERTDDYVHRNYKRVAEVWMDEYKLYLYDYGQGVYEKIDAGDLSAQHALRQNLKCKSFKWYMEKIAFDLSLYYPPVQPPDYAHGAIQSLLSPNLCIDTLGRRNNRRIGVANCSANLKQPALTQNWSLSWVHDLRLRRQNDCLEMRRHHTNASAWLNVCRLEDDTQLWFYDRKHQWIVNTYFGKKCFEVFPEESHLFLNDCKEDNLRMRWRFAVVNNTALDLLDKEDEDSGWINKRKK